MKKRLLLFLVLVGLLTFSSGCSNDSEMWRASDKRHKVTLYSVDGKVLREWVSDGTVFSFSYGLGFRDEKTHQAVKVSGTIVAEVIP